VVACAGCGAVAAAGQIQQTSKVAVTVSAWPNGTFVLDQGWRMHDGDNAAWAQPDFDDSKWQEVHLDEPGTGWRWYRFSVRLPEAHAPLALLVIGGYGTYEVYVNGQRTPGADLRPALLVTYPKQRVIPLPGISGDTEIALRTFVPPTSMFLADRSAWKIEIGTAPAVQTAGRAAQSLRLNAVVPGMGVHLLVFLTGISLLILFRLQRNHREYLWLGVYLMLDAWGSALFELAAGGFIPFSGNWLLSVPTVYLNSIAQIEFTFSFVGQRVNRAWRIYEGLLLIPPILLLVPAWFGIISRGLFNVDEVLLIVPASIALPILLLFWYRRGLREAGWLILPSLLPMFAIALDDLGIVGSYLGWKHRTPLEGGIRAGMFNLELFDVADLLFLLAVGVVMIFRFTRVSEEQVRSVGEFQAAREMQQRLVPVSLPAIAGLRVEAAYLPAEEVGGDFYQVLEQKDGSTLIVVGDVSGKGLKAAMTGTLAIGALRSLADEGLPPGLLLTRLNRQIARAEDGGFVTCLCVRVAPDGTAWAANAGHLAPYRNGEELLLDSGLPLGVLADAEFAECAFRLEPGDTLTFVSDGVVEAQSATGELFGFERTRTMSGASAEAIAQAAQAFGQADDITVVRLTLAGTGVVHA
jgi:hypothetical protein